MLEQTHKCTPISNQNLAEIGIDISKQYSKSIDEFGDVDIDLAVTVCQSSAKTNCVLCSSPWLWVDQNW